MYHVFNDLTATFYREPGRHFHGQIKGINALSIVDFQQQVADIEADLRVMRAGFEDFM
jgi:hypothetical protein